MSYNQCWLNYPPIHGFQEADLLTKLYVCNDKDNPVGSVICNAQMELCNALNGMLNIEVQSNEVSSAKQVSLIKNAVVLALYNHSAVKELTTQYQWNEEGYLIKELASRLYIIGKTEVGILYGVFDLIRRIASGSALKGLEVIEKPANKLRMLNHWDNVDGKIERGYSGNSFFFEKEELLVNNRTRDYSRIVASVGINGVVINNVNVRGKAASGLITDRYLGKLKEMAEIFAGYGIKLFLSANFAAPIEIGRLSTADPCDVGVVTWWMECVQNIYRMIPNFGGFLIKADSEGRPGPFSYGRTHAEGANILARALKPYGGTLIWRCFVYNCQQDWRDRKTDRARAAYDNFMMLDGHFEDNVILQIKNGPMDFQVREPVSPLFGGLKYTNQMLEVQIAQEYTGQQKHVCYLVPMWKEVLNFNTYANDTDTKVSDIVSGRAYNQSNCGMAAVANTGNDYNWTGHDLAAANLYGYGRLCWNTELSAEEITREWIILTYPFNEKVFDVIHTILTKSWLTYEKYTSPLGIGWMVNPNNHYGPNVDGYEYDKWGTYHRADRKGVGVDRTKQGTGYASQYNEPNASRYENIDTCPEELLLFFHYVRYDYVLKNGKTLIQHIYDTHFEGVDEVSDMRKRFKELQGLLPEDVYQRVCDLLSVQLESAIEWRDRINTYFYRKAGMEDIHQRIIYP